jgi:hypothetical protein
MGARHEAEPATGEATASGSAVRDVNDLGAGIRFNFPGFAAFRPISWDEWFGNFDRHELVFVYDEPDAEQIAPHAYARWQARGGGDGSDQEDWYAAEREVQTGSIGLHPARYRLVKHPHER